MKQRLSLLGLIGLAIGLLAPPAQAQYLQKQSDTTRVLVFLMVSSTDHVTAVTGITPTVTLSKNGAAFASATGTVAEIANGWYKLTPSSADVGTLGVLILHATGTGADPTDVRYQIIAWDPVDSVRAGLTALPNAAAAASGGVPTVDASNAVKVQSGTGANQINLSSGNVTVGGYASGQDPATLVLAGVVDGTLTLKQTAAIAQAIIAGKYSISRNATTGVQTTTYYKNDGTTTIAVSTATPDAQGRAYTRTWVFSNLP